MNKGLKEKNDLKGRSNQLPTENTKILRDFHCAGLLSIMATALEFQNAWAAAQTPTGEETGIPKHKAKLSWLPSNAIATPQWPAVASNSDRPWPAPAL